MATSILQLVRPLVFFASQMLFMQLHTCSHTVPLMMQTSSTSFSHTIRTPNMLSCQSTHQRRRDNSKDWLKSMPIFLVKTWTGRPLYPSGIQLQMVKLFSIRSVTTIQLQSFLLTLVQLAEHLQSYYTKWKKNVNKKNLISQVITKVCALENKHQNVDCSFRVPAVTHLKTPIPPKELQVQLPSPPPVTSSSYQAIVPHNSWPATGASRLAGPSTIQHVQASFDISSNLLPDLFGADEEPTVKNMLKHKCALNENGGPQKKQTCPKCGQLSCKGSGRRVYCESPCQDCEWLDCMGQNSKHSDKVCMVGELLSGVTGGRPRKT